MNIEQYISSGLIESYVLGLASPAEIEEMETLASQHAAIREAIETYRKTVEDYGDLHAVQPPAELKSRIMEALRQEAPHTGSEKLSSRSRSVRRGTSHALGRWRRVAVAAIVLLAGSLVLNIIYMGKYRESRNLVTEMVRSQQQLLTQNGAMETRLQQTEHNLQMLLNPAMKPVVMEGVETHPGMVATVYWDPQNRHAYFGASNLPVPPQGMAYQLWAIIDGKPVDMGMYHPEAEKNPTPMKNVAPGNVQAFAITLEKQEGSPVPTMAQMYVMGKV